MRGDRSTLPQFGRDLYDTSAWIALPAPECCVPKAFGPSLSLCLPLSLVSRESAQIGRAFTSQQRPCTQVGACYRPRKNCHVPLRVSWYSSCTVRDATHTHPPPQSPVSLSPRSLNSTEVHTHLPSYIRRRGQEPAASITTTSMYIAPLLVSPHSHSLLVHFERQRHAVHRRRRRCTLC